MKNKLFYTFFIVLCLLSSCKSKERRINDNPKQEIAQGISSEREKIDKAQSGVQNEELSDDKGEQIISNENAVSKSSMGNENQKSSVGAPFIFYILPLFIISLIVGIIFFLFKMKEKMKSLRREIDDVRKHISFPPKDISNKQMTELKKKINTLEESIKILEEQTSTPDKTVICNFETKSNINQEEKKTYRENDILFAERKKNTSDSLDFTEKSTRDTLYKLKKIDKNKFLFEIFTNLSDFTLKKIVNRPEELDNECFNLNSNQEFKSKITTAKEGVLIMKNEKCEVKQKAEIKFE